MKIKWIKILSNRWKVVYGDKWAESEELYGLTKMMEQTIFINSKPPSDKQYSTLFHEIVHAVDEELKIGLKERQVMLLEAGLVQMLRENPHFVAELVKTNQKAPDEE